MSDHRGRSVPAAVLRAFRCPTCSQEGAAAPGGLRCDLGHLTPWRDGYLDATTDTMPADPAARRTSDSFGYEWTRFCRLHPEDEKFWRRYVADLDLAQLNGRLGLDAGCGNGRFSRFTSPHLGALVASDGSTATQAAAANLADQPNACVIRADLRAMPFAPGSFGFISCLGVLHHLPDPEAGLEALTRLLAPGGLMLVYLYSRPERPGLRAWALRAAGQLRRLTVPMPRAALRVLSWPLAAALYAAFVVPGAIGERLRIERLASTPLAAYRGGPLRSLWLDTFDRLSAPLEARFTPGEAEAMFAGCGLSVKARRIDPKLEGIVVLAENPARPPRPA